jgi:hypothetical protein
MNSIETAFFIPLELTNEAHAYAKKFAEEQATNWKAKQVYLNTLAVCTVHNYLQWMEFETDPSQGDSWNPGIRALFNVADLVLPGIGKLECRPVLPGETVISLPLEMTEDRIGYVAVQFEEQLDKVKLLGFYPLVDRENPPEVIQLTELKSFESLIERLEELETEISLLEKEFEAVIATRRSDDPVAVRIQEILENKSIPEIAADFERIYRTCDRQDWWNEGGKILLPSVSGVGGTDRELKGDSTQDISDAEVELRDLAEELLKKLAEIWGDSA